MPVSLIMGGPFDHTECAYFNNLSLIGTNRCPGTDKLSAAPAFLLKLFSGLAHVSQQMVDRLRN